MTSLDGTVDSDVTKGVITTGSNQMKFRLVVIMLGIFCFFKHFTFVQPVPPLHHLAWTSKRCFYF